MLQFEGWKKAIVAIVCLVGFIYAAPNVIGGREGGGFLPGQSINLGLDLQGGSHLLLQVDSEAVQIERLESIGESLRLEFRDARVRFKKLAVTGTQLSFSLRDEDGISIRDQALNALGNDFIIETQGLESIVQFSEQGIINLQSSTVEQSIEIYSLRLRKNHLV